MPRERQRQLNEGLEDVDVLGPDEPKQREFALVLTDDPGPSWGVRLDEKIDRVLLARDCLTGAAELLAVVGTG
jgi:hypothetical protein